MGAYEMLAGCYDRLTNDVDYEAIAAFYRTLLRREGVRPRTAVDLACGTGSVTAILAREGLRVIGVDMSEEMLTQAAAKTAGLEPMPVFVRQKLSELFLLLIGKAVLLRHFIRRFMRYPNIQISSRNAFCCFDNISVAVISRGHNILSP